MGMHEVVPFVPKTRTVNQDRRYYVRDGVTFIKEDCDVLRGQNEARVIRFLAGQERRCRHVQVFERSYVDPERQVHVLETEYFSGAETLENLGTLPEEQRSLVIDQLLGVYAFLLRCGVIHGDINVSNVLFNGADIQVIDFECGELADTSERGAYARRFAKDMIGPPAGILDLLDRI